MGHRRSLWLSVSMAVPFVSFLGCSTPKMEPLAAPTHGTFPFSTNCLGLEVAVDPFFEAERVKRHFGEDLLSHAIVPLRVAITNTRQEGAYLLQPESVTLLGARNEPAISPADGSAAAPDHGRGLAAYENVVFPLAFLASPLAALATAPLGFALDESRRDAIDVAKHMEAVRFQDRPLYPSDSNNGFIYFRVPRTNDLQKITALRFQVRNLRSREEIAVVVPIRTD